MADCNFVPFVTKNINESFNMLFKEVCILKNTVGNQTRWGNIVGSLPSQVDLQQNFDSKTPISRVITINGTSFDLSQDRIWNISTNPFTVGSPLTFISNVISIPQSSSIDNGYLSQTDWNTFNSKQDTLSGIGFIKLSGTTVTYDNNSYLTALVAASIYQPIGAYLTGITNAQIVIALGFTPYDASNPANYITTSGLSSYLLSTTAASTYQPIGSYLTGITNLQVTNALGFTPYNSTNPTGYITASALSSYLLSSIASTTYQPIGSYLTGITSSNVTTALGFTPYNSANPSGYISSVPAQTFSSLTGKPTTLLGYGITDAYPLVGNPSGFLTSIAAQTFASLTGKPTTLSGYGITDATPSIRTITINGNTQNLQSDLSFTVGGVSSVFGRSGVISAQSGDYNFSQISSKPTTLTGYGITDAYPLTGNPSGFLITIPAQSFSSLTGKPTTTAGYGITDIVSQSLTGYSSTTGILSSSDTIVGAISKLNGNIGLAATNASVVHLAGAETITGVKTFTDAVGAASGSLAGSLLALNQTWNTTGSPTAILLNVTNTASGASSKLMDLKVGGVSQFTLDKSGNMYIPGYLSLATVYSIDISTDRLLNLGGVSSTFRNTAGIASNKSYPRFGSSGNYNIAFWSSDTYNPYTGGGGFSAFQFDGIINQTGGSNGISRGVYVNPTLTAAADFRALETTNNTGKAFFASGTAPSQFNGVVIAGAQIRLKGYTVATLPTGTIGDTAYATDLTSPTYLGTAVGGGVVIGPVFYNGTTWVCH